MGPEVPAKLVRRRRGPSLRTPRAGRCRAARCGRREHGGRNLLAGRQLRREPETLRADRCGPGGQVRLRELGAEMDLEGAETGAEQRRQVLRAGFDRHGDLGVGRQLRRQGPVVLARDRPGRGRVKVEAQIVRPDSGGGLGVGRGAQAADLELDPPRSCVRRAEGIDAGDHMADLLVGQFRKDRQAEAWAADFLGDGKAAGTRAEAGHSTAAGAAAPDRSSRCPTSWSFRCSRSASRRGWRKRELVADALPRSPAAPAGAPAPGGFPAGSARRSPAGGRSSRPDAAA